MNLQNKTAKDYFYEKKYFSALKIFKQENDYYSAGLCALLLKKQIAAKIYWKISSRTNPAARWGLGVLDLIHLNKPTLMPSFFQTRAQLELYLNLFLENELIEWAQNLISMCDELYKSNPETYKFIARALFSNGYFDLAITFCKKSLNLFYCDPEALLILSQCYYLIGNLGEALDCVNRIIAMVDGYYPAIMFRKILKEKIEEKNTAKK